MLPHMVVVQLKKHAERIKAAPAESPLQADRLFELDTYLFELRSTHPGYFKQDLQADIRFVTARATRLG